MGIMRAQQEQRHWHHQQELFRGCVLVSVVDLLPHVEIVVGARVELEGHAPHIVEHKVRPDHVGYVRQGPGDLLGDAGDDVEEDLEGEDEDGVDRPCALRLSC